MIIERLNTKRGGCHVHGIGDRPALLTAEQFAERPDPGYPEELVKGRIVAMSVPKPRHGEICSNAVFICRSTCPRTVTSVACSVTTRV